MPVRNFKDGCFKGSFKVDTQTDHLKQLQRIKSKLLELDTLIERGRQWRFRKDLILLALIAILLWLRAFNV